jgi:flagellar hook-associated protein 3 FlgL
MVVSTATLNWIPQNAVARLQTRITKAETELSTGQLADPVGDLGSQAGLFQSLQAQSATLNNIQTANSIAQFNMTAAQSALDSINTDAQKFVKELVTAQNSGTLTTLVSDTQSLLDDLTTSLNTAAGGIYVFGGVNNTVKPLLYDKQGPQAVTAATYAAYCATQPSPLTPTAMQGFLTGPLADLFSGKNWTTNWSKASSTPTSVQIQSQQVITSVTANNPAFGQLASAYASIADLNISSLGESTRQAVLANAIKVASAAMAGITTMQATLGLSQSQITNINTQLRSQASFLDNWAAKLGSVEPSKAATELSNLTTQLETAYSLTNRISRLSLVNYLSS